MFKILKITSTFVFGLSLAMAQPPTRSTPTFSEVKSYLALSDSQLSSLNAIQNSERSAAQSLHQQIQSKRSALEGTLSTGSNASAAGQILLDIENLRKQITALNTTYQSQALAVLNDAQKAKLKTLEDARKLVTQIHQAESLNLIAPAAGEGHGFGRRMGPMAGPGRGMNRAANGQPPQSRRHGPPAPPME